MVSDFGSAVDVVFVELPATQLEDSIALPIIKLIYRCMPFSKMSDCLRKLLALFALKHPRVSMVHHTDVTVKVHVSNTREQVESLPKWHVANVVDKKATIPITITTAVTVYLNPLITA